MGLLDEIKKRASQFYQDVQNPHPGSWKVAGVSLPDIGLTEIIKPVHAAETTPTTDYGYDNRQTTWDPYISIFNNPTAGQQTTRTTGQTTGTGSTDTGSGDPGTREAENSLYSRLNSILNNLALYRQMAQAERERAGKYKEEVLGKIKTSYEDLLNKAGQAKNRALETLGQEDISVQNLYGRAAGTARRAMESALLGNRMAARAMNRLNSSFYDDLQARTRESGARTLGEIAEEEAGKRSDIGTRTTDAKTWFDQQTVEIERERQDLDNQAEKDYQEQLRLADFEEKAYGIDAIDQAAQAERDYLSRLDAIRQYAQNKALTVAQIAAQAGNRQGILEAFRAITPELQRNLVSDTALNASRAFVAGLANRLGLGGLGGGGADMSAFATMKEDPEAQYYESLRRLGLLY